MAAFLFGVLSAMSLVIGAALGVTSRPPQRAVAAIMAFGAGALLSALSFELIQKAYDSGGIAPVGIGAIVGGVAFVWLNELLNGQGGFLRKAATTARYVQDRKRERAENLLDRLSRVGVLRALPPEDVQAIVPHVEVVQAPAGTRIFLLGEPGDALYLIDEGEVDLLTELGSPDAADGVERLPRLGAGDAFGEMALLTGEPRTATAQAVAEVTLFRIPKDDFDELVAASPRLSLALSGLLARRLQATSLRQLEQEVEAKHWRAQALRNVDALTLAATPTEVRTIAREHVSSAPMGIFLGLLLDGIPESLVIGMSMIGQPTVSAALILGLFLSNLPEAMSSAVGMRGQGTSTARILGMWTFLMLFTGLGAFLGNLLFVGVPIGVIAGFEAAAAGAMLTMIAMTALPEAYEQGGWLSGLATLLGFLAAFAVGALSGQPH